MEQLLNCIGLACPIPVVKSKKAIEAFSENGTLTVLADNETCVSNLTKLAASMNLPIESEQTGEKEYTVKISVDTEEVKKHMGGPELPEGVSCELPKGVRPTVVLAANTMGSGDEALGKALMKAFLFALTNADIVPERIICYNSGAYLTCEGSESLEDLKNLKEAGAEIFTCGTCLNFYGLTEKLAVGEVSNMYAIVEMQMKAGKIIRP